MVGFLQYTIVYAFIYSAILIYLLHKTSSRNAKFAKSILNHHFISLVVGMVIICLPVSLYTIMVTHSYPSPDTYGDIIACNMEFWGSLPIDPYYRAYPIYVILNKFVGIVTELDYSLSILLLHISSILMTFLSVILLIKHFGERRACIKHALLYSLIFIDTIYLYSYFNIFIPQSFALWIIGFMMLALLNNMLIPFILLSILALVHIGVIPLFIIIILLQTLFKAFKLSNNSDLNRWVKRSTIIIPAVLHLLYIAYLYGGQSLITYLHYYIKILYDTIFRPENVASVLYTTSGGLQRQYFFVNALAPGSFLSLVLVGLYLVFFRKEKYSPVISAFGILGMVLLSIGVARYYNVTEVPSVSVARYTNVYGFYFLSIFAAHTVYYILRRYGDEKIHYAIFIMLVLGVLGSFTDPFTFPYKPSVSDVEFMKITSQVITLQIPVYFHETQDWYYLGHQLSFWVYNTKKVLIKFTTILNVSISEETCSILFSSKLRHIYLLESTMTIIVIT